MGPAADMLTGRLRPGTSCMAVPVTTTVTVWWTRSTVTDALGCWSSWSWEVDRGISGALSGRTRVGDAVCGGGLQPLGGGGLGHLIGELEERVLDHRHDQHQHHGHGDGELDHGDPAVGPAPSHRPQSRHAPLPQQPLRGLLALLTVVSLRQLVRLLTNAMTATTRTAMITSAATAQSATWIISTPRSPTWRRRRPPPHAALRRGLPSEPHHVAASFLVVVRLIRYFKSVRNAGAARNRVKPTSGRTLTAAICSLAHVLLGLDPDQPAAAERLAEGLQGLGDARTVLAGQRHPGRQLLEGVETELSSPAGRAPPTAAPDRCAPR